MHGRPDGRLDAAAAGVRPAWRANIIPTAADQPTNSFYNAADPADYAPEADLPSGYPSVISSSTPVGTRPDRGRAAHDLQHAERLRHALDPRRRQLLRLRAARRRHVAAVVHQHVPARAAGVHRGRRCRSRRGRTSSGARAPAGGFLPLFITWPAPARQWRYTNAPDADARLDPGDVLGEAVRRRARRQRDRRLAGGQGRADGRLPALRDVRQVLQDDGLHQPAVPGRHRLQRGALPDVLVLRVGRRHRRPGRLGVAHRLEPQPLRLPEPDGRARADNGAGAAPRSGATASRDWTTSLGAPARVLPLAAVGRRRHRAAAPPTAGAGATRRRPRGRRRSTGCSTRRTRSTSIPGSNTWFGFQAWSMERVAEYYYATGNASAKLDPRQVGPLGDGQHAPARDGSYEVPSTLDWDGQPSLNWTATTQNWNAADATYNAACARPSSTARRTSGVTAALPRRSSTTAPAAALGLRITSRRRRWRRSCSTACGRSTATRSASRCPRRGRDYNRFDDPVFVPARLQRRDAERRSHQRRSTFIGLRLATTVSDPAWPQVQALSGRRTGADVHVPPVLGTGGHRARQRGVRPALPVTDVGARDKNGSTGFHKFRRVPQVPFHFSGSGFCRFWVLAAEPSRT